jgi:hypothetical protein
MSFPKLARFFSVIGMNAILLYLLTSVFNWSYVVNSLVGNLIKVSPDALQPLLLVVAMVVIQWCLAKYLSIKKIYLKV